ncbi:outer membrane protein assembly factor BamD [Planktomarina temperata]|jgi:outer membrane protein assembly factor BamD|uniref:outer membrane protein assembly factor BamD n=1 Tax=Planktomarina TaxID=1284657 RepID=UPI002302FAA2|nr:outer membrane protein assembly factor BamD [Planktomarina temperata]MDA8875428.1 outer membrane protein assembly factor BamD [Planktomarina temperata]MDB0071218.1 outer membrane protein assembly factor BamD [Planktomarina temperata]MDB4200309.1 outer membrane protein assembly factor BamD [Planktomarina temperata]MDC1233763.1 outer membrane protein assembly factor BamD [Planktomarina temperata]
MRSHYVILLCFLTVAISGCSALKSKPKIDIDTYSAKEIYDLAEDRLAKKRPQDAAKYFSEIERLYPYSEWAKRGLIMQAYSYHKDQDYENSRSAAQRYIDFFPAAEDAAYAQYILALSYYDQISEVGRDQDVTVKALQELRLLIERYPDSKYAKDSAEKFDMAFSFLAAKEMEVGRYYLQRGYYTSAVNRFRKVVQEFRTTEQTPEALYRLIECYLSLGLRGEAQSAAAILQESYSSTQWHKDSLILLSGEGLLPDAGGQNWLSTIYRQTIKGQWL